MSVDAVMLYETLYSLASKSSADQLFGLNSPLAQEAFRRALAGQEMPIIWFEVPLSGAPRFDLHVAHSNDALHKGALFAADAMDGNGELLNWYASNQRQGGGLALAYDVGDGRVEAPAVHVNVNGASAFDAKGFFNCVCRADATALYERFIKRLPQGWRVWYFGVHPGRLGAPVRVDCFVDKALKQRYAVDSAKFKEDLYFHVSLILALLYSLAISAEIGIIVDFVERIIGSTLWVLFWSPVIALSSAVLHFVVLRGIASFAESLKYYRLMKILRLRRRRRLQRMRAIRTARAHQ